MEEIKKFKEFSDVVIGECSRALGSIKAESVLNAIDAILSAEKVFFIGVGRSMLALQAMAKRFAHLGIDAYCVGQITEPAITVKDVLIVGSGSGESLIPVTIAKKADRIGAKIIHVGSNPESSLKEITDVFLRIPVRTKLALADEIDSKQPMTTIFDQTLLLLGDIMALMIIDRKNLNMQQLWQYHANLE